MLPILSRIKIWWTTADRSQRTVTLAGIGGLLFLLIATAVFVTRPHYEILASGVTDMRKGEMVEALTAGGITPKADQKGVIEVPAGKGEDAMMILAKAGKLPKTSEHWGLEKLDTIGFGVSQGREDQMMKGVLEGRLSSIAETIPGVASAQVLLTIPQNRVFADDKQHPTASVVFVEDGTAALSPKDGRTFATVVCNAVTGMTLADVAVTSSTSGTLWDGSDLGGAGGSTKTERDEQASRLWEGKIQSALDIAYGPNSTKVIARADLDMDQVVTNDHIVTPTDRPTVVMNKKEDAVGNGKGVGGVAGAPSNTGTAAPAQPATGATTPGTYNSNDKSTQFDTSVTEKRTQAAIGDMKELAISVIANSDKVPDVSAVRSIVNGVLGGKIQMDAKGVPLPGQAFSAEVTSVKFDGTAAAAAKAAADAAAGAQRMQAIMSLLPIGAILVVALLVAKQVGKISRAVLPAPAALEEGPAERGDYNALPLAEGEGQGQVNAGLAALEAGDPVPEAQDIRDRVNLPLESIKKMAADRPEMVATLIKSMMLGEK